MSMETLDTRCEATVRGRRCAEEPDNRGGGNMELNPYCEECGKNLCPKHLEKHRCKAKKLAAKQSDGEPCLLCPDKIDKKDEVTFVDNSDPSKGMAHLKCANTLRTPAEFLGENGDFDVKPRDPNKPRCESLKPPVAGEAPHHQCENNVDHEGRHHARVDSAIYYWGAWSRTEIQTEAIRRVDEALAAWKKAEKKLKLSRKPEALKAARAECKATETAYRQAAYYRDRVFGQPTTPERYRMPKTKPKAKAAPVRLTHEDINWPDEALLGGDERCQGCNEELLAGEPITPINQCAYVHLKCVHDWYHGESTGKAVGWTLKQKKS